MPSRVVQQWKTANSRLCQDVFLPRDISPSSSLRLSGATSLRHERAAVVAFGGSDDKSVPENRKPKAVVPVGTDRCGQW